MANTDKKTKTSNVVIRLKPIDRNYLIEQSNKNGITMSDYLRRLILQDSFKKKNNIQ